MLKSKFLLTFSQIIPLQLTYNALQNKSLIIKTIKTSTLWSSRRFARVLIGKKILEDLRIAQYNSTAKLKLETTNYKQSPLKNVPAKPT